MWIFSAVPFLENLKSLTGAKLELEYQPILFGKTDPRCFIRISGAEKVVSYTGTIIAKKIKDVDEKLTDL